MTRSNTLPNVGRPESSMCAYFSYSNHADNDSLTCRSPTQTPEARSEYEVTLSITPKCIPKTNDTSDKGTVYDHPYLSKSTSQRTNHSNTVLSSRDTAAIQNNNSSGSIIDTKTRCSFTVQLFAAESQDNLITNIEEEQVVSHNRYVNM